MKAEYKRDLQNNFLILEAPQDAEEESCRFQMAMRNEIPGLLPFHSTRKDGVLYLNYEITSRHPVETVYEKKTMKYEDIVFLLTGIAGVLDSIQKYLLDPAELIFDPGFLYLDTACSRVLFCYLPGGGNCFPISLLAEFILKRLDHTDQQAVALGYDLYQRTLEENFSLQKLLRNALGAAQAARQMDSGITGMNGRPGSGVTGMNGRPGSGATGMNGRPGSGAAAGMAGADGNRDAAGGAAGAAGRTGSEVAGVTARSAGGSSGRRGLPAEDVYAEEPAGNAREPRRRGTAESARDYGDTYADSYAAPGGAARVDLAEGVPPEIRESYEVTHLERGKRPQKKLDRLFQLIHPGVLLSSLFLLAVLEIAFYFGMINITEAGGIFFLLISVETMINKFWKSSRERESRPQWDAEDEEGLYEALQEEMYEPPQDRETVGETRCLAPAQEAERLSLICVSAGDSGAAGPDILIGEEPVYIGKLKGESDVLLDSPTVSRRHARLACRDGTYYVKDLNSRNGTFCNGRKLQPQEQCEFTQGDQIAFAEVVYRAVLRGTSRSTDP